MTQNEQFDIDKVIEKLRQNNSKKKQVLQQEQIRVICQRVRQIFMQQPMLLELSAPIKVCGDIHGQFPDLLKIFETAGVPGQQNYLFIGDYVDRGKQSVQCMVLLFAYKIKFPENFFLLRGNHECSSINRIYGFYDECKIYVYIQKLWKLFSDVFNTMPVCAVIEEKIICMHGGLSPQFENYDQLQTIPRPIEIPDQGLLCDLLWSDPDKDVIGWDENERGISYIFGADVVQNFLKKHNLDLVCRAHQVVEEGYEFFNQRQLVTIFSAPNYCGEFQNHGAVMNINEQLLCSFQILPGLRGLD